MAGHGLEYTLPILGGVPGNLATRGALKCGVYVPAIRQIALAIRRSIFLTEQLEVLIE